MLPGRNDPCPCGSGKKYKKCHGLAETLAQPLEAARATALKKADVELTSRLLSFAQTTSGPNWLHDALEEDGFSTDDPEWEASMPLLLPWYLYFRPLEDGATLAGNWRRSQTRPLRTNEQILLDAYADAWVSIWEVAEVVPGTGSHLVDLLTNETRFAIDASSSRTLQRFDTLLGIVLDFDGVSFFGGAHSQPLSPRFAASSVKEARRVCRVRTRPVTRAKLQDPDLQLTLLDLWNDAVEDMVDQPPPTLQNTDGDRMVPTTDDFALLAPRDAVAARLAALPGVQEPEQAGSDTVFVVTRPGNSVHASWNNTIIGHLRLSSARLLLETNSSRRADALRSAVQAQLGAMVRFRLRKEDNADKMLAELRASPHRTPRPAPAVPAEAAAALREFRERYMRYWLDMSIPMLGGLTPRQAAASRRERGKLDALIKEMRQDEERLPADQRIDLEAILAELGSTG